MNEDSNPDVDSIRKEEPFPPEFLGSVTDTAFTTLEDYLKRYHAPEMLISLFRDLIYVQDLMTTDPDRFLPGGRPRFNLEIQETVSRLTWEIVLLGGEFKGAYSVSARREPIRWEVGDAA